MGERYLYRSEQQNLEPSGDPVKAIVLDRKLGRYHLLTESQSVLARDAVAGNLGEQTYVKADKPFPVDLDLTTMARNTQVIELERGESPENVLSAPMTAYTEVAWKCNLDCRDCYQGRRVITNPITDDEHVAFLRRFQEIGGMIVRYTGKEPTTHPQLPDFIYYGRQLGLKMALNTNGYIGPRTTERLIQAGVQEVVVSLDGDRKTNDAVRGEGVHDRAVETLRVFLANGVDARINMTIGRSNLDQLEYMMRLAHELGTYVSVIPMRNLGNASENLQDELLTPELMRQAVIQFDALQAELEQGGAESFIYFNVLSDKPRYYHPFFQMTPCVARKNIFVDCEGNVFPCDHLVNLGDAYRGGNVRKTDLLEIWRNGPGLVRYRDLQRNATCQACAEFGIRCDGGCTSEFLVACGGSATEVQDRLCFLHPRE
jgi:mycofactocin biosynthetic radical S-adenosylmethionine protein MftC